MQRVKARGSITTIILLQYYYNNYVTYSQNKDIVIRYILTFHYPTPFLYSPEKKKNCKISCHYFNKPNLPKQKKKKRTKNTTKGSPRDSKAVLIEFEAN